MTNNKTVIGYKKNSPSLKKDFDGLVATTLNGIPQLAFIVGNDIIFRNAADIVFPPKKINKSIKK